MSKRSDVCCCSSIGRRTARIEQLLPDVLRFVVGRDDFNQPTKDVLARRAGYMCSKPGCRAGTVGPSLESETDVANIGVAAHIAAASANGPRFDPAMSAEQRSSYKNGIWLCANDAAWIDRDTTQFTAQQLHEWKRQHEAWVLAQIGVPRTATNGDDEERAYKARDLYQAALIGMFLERLTREDFERLLVAVGHGEVLAEVTEDTSYPALIRYTLTRAVVRDWLADLLRLAPGGFAEDAWVQSFVEALARPDSPKHARRRIASLLQHMARLEGQQVQTPGYLWIAHGHETGHTPSGADTDEEHGGSLFDYMGASDLESTRAHLHEVLETVEGIIAELESDTAIAEEAPDAYVALRRGMSDRATILRHALRHGAAESASTDYQRLINERPAAVELLLQRLRDRG